MKFLSVKMVIRPSIRARASKKGNQSEPLLVNEAPVHLPRGSPEKDPAGEPIKHRQEADIALPWK
jgi:hypothetical protein